MLFVLFFIILLYLLIPTVIAQILTAELAISTETQNNEENVKIETQAVTVETKISKFFT